MQGGKPRQLQEDLALGELRALAGLLQAVLLALDGTGVAGEEASLLEVGAVVASLEEGAGDAEAQGAGLTGDAAAVAQGDDVEVLNGVGNLEGRAGVVNELLAAEVVQRVAAVDGDLAGAGDETDSGDSLLAAAGAI